MGSSKGRRLLRFRIRGQVGHWRERSSASFRRTSVVRGRVFGSFSFRSRRLASFGTRFLGLSAQLGPVSVNHLVGTAERYKRSLSASTSSLRRYSGKHPQVVLGNPFVELRSVSDPRDKVFSKVGGNDDQPPALSSQTGGHTHTRTPGSPIAPIRIPDQRTIRQLDGWIRYEMTGTGRGQIKGRQMVSQNPIEYADILASTVLNNQLMADGEQEEENSLVRFVPFGKNSK